jgi:hypothetical protein
MPPLVPTTTITTSTRLIIITITTAILTSAAFAMAGGKGDRANKAEVKFPGKFEDSPSVLVGLTKLDVSR